MTLIAEEIIFVNFVKIQTCDNFEIIDLFHLTDFRGTRKFKQLLIALYLNIYYKSSFGMLHAYQRITLIRFKIVLIKHTIRINAHIKFIHLNLENQSMQQNYLKEKMHNIHYYILNV